MKSLFLFIVVAVIGSVPGRAEQSIDISDAWIRHLPGDRPMAGYFVMENRGEVDRRLLGASSTAFGAVRMHQSTDQDGTASMQPVDSVTVPAGGRIAFEAGGYHLMLMQRQKDLEVGDRVTVTFELDDGVERSAVFPIKPAWQE